jgi:CheY-like chemotaxis protein
MKIIVADDNFTNRLLDSEILKELGHEFIEAENGREVLTTLKNRDDIDLILMDIEMPVMNGVETMNCIRQNLDFPMNRIPIVALTAHYPAMFEDDASGQGFNQTLVKPFSISKLSELLDKYNIPEPF